MRLPLLLLVLVLGACGDDGEISISNLTLDPSTVSVGVQTTVMAMFDAEGTYDQLHMKLLSPNQDVLTEDTYAKDGPNFHAPNGLMLPMSIPNAARYTLEVWVSGGGAESNPLEASLTAQ